MPELSVDTSPSREPLLDVRDLSVTFAPGAPQSVRAVDRLSYRLFAGRTLAMVGESGSGKTVGCRALMGLLPERAQVGGQVTFNGRQILGMPESAWRRIRGAEISMVFQNPVRALNPTMRISAQIVEAIRRHEPCSIRDAERRAADLLDQLRVPAVSQRLRAYPHELSGGLCQRVMIAIAMACKPKLLIADEATRSLDVVTQAEIMALLKSLQAETGMTLIIVSHDLTFAADFADEVLVMYAGTAVEHASTRQLFRGPRMRYTQALLDAIPRFDCPPHTPFRVALGQPPDPSRMPQGCAFEPRCPSALAACRNIRPQLEEHERGHRHACLNPHEAPASVEVRNGLRP